jgi:hypothetical protein
MDPKNQDDLIALHKQYLTWLAQAVEAGDKHAIEQYTRMVRRISGLLGHRNRVARRQQEQAAGGVLLPFLLQARRLSAIHRHAAGSCIRPAGRVVSTAGGRLPKVCVGRQQTRFSKMRRAFRPGGVIAALGRVTQNSFLFFLAYALISGKINTHLATLREMRSPLPLLLMAPRTGHSPIRGQKK